MWAMPCGCALYMLGAMHALPLRFAVIKRYTTCDVHECEAIRLLSAGTLQLHEANACCEPDLVQASRRSPALRAASPRDLMWLRRMRLQDQHPFRSALAMPSCIDQDTMHACCAATCLPQTVGPRHCFCGLSSSPPCIQNVLKIHRQRVWPQTWLVSCCQNFLEQTNRHAGVVDCV
jgi:hypothetical protein